MITTLLLAAMLQTVVVADVVITDDESKKLAASSNEDVALLPVVKVYSQRLNIGQSVNSSLSTLQLDEVRIEAPKHPNELFDRVPGAWISRGSGQEHLSAIRSPVLTGSGACGAFMVLEDEVPTRPSGFCNVNQLFEVNIAQANQINILRGPGTVTYGSNALHGAIDVLTAGPSAAPYTKYGLEIGSDNYYRGLFSMSGRQTALQANFTDAGSFRDDEHFQHGLFNFQANHSLGNSNGRTSLAYANLDQDTAGFILGKNSYKDEELRTQNLNPEAFRKAWAARLSSRWNWLANNGTSLELVPYARSSRMDFLQHFLPGTPLEENGQDSAGLLFSGVFSEAISAGVDLEWAEGSLIEFQESTLESGSAFLNETRPQGYHYDYDVAATTVAAWLQWQHDLRPGLQLTAGLRAENIAYDYKNHMLAGNTRDDGSECGFGGCLYTRPADRNDSFSNISPELGLSFDLSNQHLLFLRAARGYRAPQATELYRLQKGQQVADLDSETLDSVEVGLKGNVNQLSYEFNVYVMRKDNFIFRDANGFNISDGKTRHTGIETQFYWQAGSAVAISGNLSWAQHEYDFNRDLGGAEIILRGNEIDTAPPWLGALRLHWQRTDKQAVEAEWVYQGSYFLDAANAHRYGGHSVLNIRGWMAFSDSRHRLSIRLNNSLDSRYAERADYAFGNYRYFPAAGRRISLEWQFRH